VKVGLVATGSRRVYSTLAGEGTAQSSSIVELAVNDANDPAPKQIFCSFYRYRKFAWRDDEQRFIGTLSV